MYILRNKNDTNKFIFSDILLNEWDEYYSITIDNEYSTDYVYKKFIIYKNNIIQEHERAILSESTCDEEKLENLSILKNNPPIYIIDNIYIIFDKLVKKNIIRYIFYYFNPLV
ncbi:unknown similar to AMEV042 [Adoxophyes honmai entomopoxvirus 'L']|uniref:Uncharacterized protein n=1 Tax=Adoxophyes honmai entomopoxvirus 'L' TaxID=1293540 RepID=A0A916NWP0_9POXV|nr:unknown similar to AMEV042 [Adoxophyes honmai entomopoxvirus 'L']CCU55363.1 unknown similar to AMEV042 [Adoxophyes honmai entomopoxvirus 'L']